MFILKPLRETRVPSLGWEDPLEKGVVTHCSILAWRIPWTEEPGGYGLWGLTESDMTERLTVSLSRHEISIREFLTAHLSFQALCL